MCPSLFNTKPQKQRAHYNNNIQRGMQRPSLVTDKKERETGIAVT
jgi:hypothetical protein